MGAPQARLYELAKRLQGMGHELTVLTSLPNYPTGRVFKEYRGKARISEAMDGMRVVRTCLYPSNSSKTFPRLLSYLSFGLTSVLLGVWGLGKQDVVLIESPPLFLVPFALFVSRIVRGRAVMMVSDIWPDIIIRMGHAPEQSLPVKAMLWLERLSYNHSHAVAVTNPGALDQIQGRFPHLQNVTVISNGVDTEMFSAKFRSEERRRAFGAKRGDLLVGYCGLHGLAQGLDVVLDAAVKLKDKADIRFVMIGDGPTKEELVRRAQATALENLVFIDRRPKSEMPEILASLDVSLVPLAARFPGTMPSKLYEALASGTIPIVAKGCEAEALVAQFEAGRCYEPGNSDEMVRAILDLYEDEPVRKRNKDNCLNLAKRFDRSVIARRTEGILAAVSKGDPVPQVTW